jgi:hypothetical protein
MSCPKRASGRQVLAISECRRYEFRCNFYYGGIFFWLRSSELRSVETVGIPRAGSYEVNAWDKVFLSNPGRVGQFRNFPEPSSSSNICGPAMSHRSVASILDEEKGLPANYLQALHPERLKKLEIDQDQCSCAWQSNKNNEMHFSMISNAKEERTGVLN